MGVFVKRQVDYIKQEVDVILIKGNKDNIFKLVLRCIKGITKDVSIVHQHFVGISTIIIGGMCMLRHIPFILTSHGTGWEFQQSFFKRLIVKFALMFPNTIICVGKKVEAKLIQNTDKDKLLIINNGFEMSEPNKTRKDFRKELGMENNYIMISVANFVKKKGINLIIESMVELRKAFPDLVYLIIGDGLEKESLKALANKLDLNNCVKFVGKKFNEELANYYNASDIFALMSIEDENMMESFGIVYLEASYFRLPVLGRNVYDAVEDKKSGFLVENQEEFEARVSELLTDNKLRKELGDYGRKRVLNKFMLKDKVSNILDLYNREIKRMM